MTLQNAGRSRTRPVCGGGRAAPRPARTHPGRGLWPARDHPRGRRRTEARPTRGRHRAPRALASPLLPRCARSFPSPNRRVIDPRNYARCRRRRELELIDVVSEGGWGRDGAGSRCARPWPKEFSRPPSIPDEGRAGVRRKPPAGGLPGVPEGPALLRSSRDGPECGTLTRLTRPCRFVPRSRTDGGRPRPHSVRRTARGSFQ